MITFAPLWETMKQRHITTYALIKNLLVQPRHAGLSQAQPQYYHRNTQ